jgi:hypothetical protein
MQTESQDISFDDIIVSYNPEIQKLAIRLRELIAEVHPEAVEVLWPKQKIAGFGVGPKKMTEHYSYIAPQTKHVNLGFNHGASLSDPDGKLEGTGKSLRHVKVYTLEETEQPELRELLREAVAERHAALK